MKRVLFCLLLSAAAADARSEVVDYVGEVLPIMKKHCWDCHSRETSVKGNLALDPEALPDQIGKYNIIRPGEPDASGFVERMKLDEGHADFMPRKGSSLPKREIAAIEEWIRQGAIVDAKKPTEEEAKRLAESGAPAPTPKEAAKTDAFHTWTNQAGKTIEARFLGLQGEAAKLVMRNGKSYLVPLSTLDAASVEQAKQLATP